MPTRNKKGSQSTSEGGPTIARKPGRIAAEARQGTHMRHDGSTGKLNGRLKGNPSQRSAAHKALQLSKAMVVETLTDGWSVTAAARQVGVDRSTLYAWRDEDPQFRAAWYDATEAGGDWYEDRLRQQSASDHVASVTATIVGLKTKGRFVDTQRIDQRSVSISASVDLSRVSDEDLEDLLGLQARRRQALESPKLEG